MSIATWLTETFQSPSALLNKLQSPGYLASMQSRYAIPSEYEKWLKKQLAQTQARAEIDRHKGRTHNNDTLLRIQQTLQDELKKLAA